jgi:hypothetical protein
MKTFSHLNRYQLFYQTPMPNASEPQKLSIFPYFIGFPVGILGIFTGQTDAGRRTKERACCNYMQQAP